MVRGFCALLAAVALAATPAGASHVAGHQTGAAGHQTGFTHRPTHPAGPRPGRAGTAASLAGWHLIADDEFNGRRVDTWKWWIYDGTGNEGVGLRRPSAVTEADGELRITGRGQVSGGIQMQQAFLYGRVEIRARDDRGVGFGPALLLWPANGDWPVAGEIDMVEIPEGSRLVAQFASHFGTNDQQVTRIMHGHFVRWNTWLLDWEPTGLREWLNGRLVADITTPAAIPHDPMRVALQNDVGASGHFIGPADITTPAEVTLHVDYVRIYQRDRRR